MRRRRPSRRTLAGGLALVVAIIVGVSLAPDLSADASGASPTTLSRMGRNNDRAAAVAAAQMRDRSRASANAADSMRAAQERGRAEADAMLARFDNQAPGEDRPAPAAEQ